MPSPEAGGRSRARPQNMPRSGLVTKALTAASCRPAFRPSLQAATMPAVPQCQPLHAPVQWVAFPGYTFDLSPGRGAIARVFSHRAGAGRIHRASPCGPDHAGMLARRARPPLSRIRGIAVAARQKQVFVGSQGPEARRALPAAERPLSSRSLPRGLEIDQERERLEKKSRFLPVVETRNRRRESPCKLAQDRRADVGRRAREERSRAVASHEPAPPRARRLCVVRRPGSERVRAVALRIGNPAQSSEWNPMRLRGGSGGASSWRMASKTILN